MWATEYEDIRPKYKKFGNIYRAFKVQIKDKQSIYTSDEF